MDAYNDSLSFKKGEFLDKFNLLVSKITNNYGLNWWRPIWIYFALTLIVFLILYLVETEFHLRELSNIFNTTDFGRMLNPTHGFDNFEVIKPENTGRVIIDLIIRIIQGLLVYQTISAFRKFFK